MSPFRVGLTGGLAAGKSTVGKRLAQAGFEVVDADRLVATLYLPGADGARAVARLFGDEYLDADGGVDHDRLASLVFTDVTSRERLEEVIHPLVGRAFEAIAESSSGVVVLEATLLIESGLAERFDLVVTVEADAETRRQRAAERGLAAVDAERRLRSQSAREVRTRAADVVIENNGSREELDERIDRLIEDLLRRAGNAN